MSLSKRITYLKGMAEGLGLGNSTKEERVLKLIIEILDEMTDELDALSTNVLVLDDDVSSILDDVHSIEATASYVGQEDPEETPPLFAPQAQANTSHSPPRQKTPPPVKPPQFYVVGCPRCQDEITLDEDILKLGHIHCPTCDERLEFDLEDE